MSIRSLHRRLGRLAESNGLRRCACGAILPTALTQPPRIDIADGYDLPASLQALVPLATPAEAHELQALLNRCLELHPNLAGRRGTSHRIYGGEPADASLLRFHFAEADAGPHCPKCGTAVVSDYAVRSVALLAPAPDELLEALPGEPKLAARYEAIVTRLRHRADGHPGDVP